MGRTWKAQGRIALLVAVSLIALLSYMGLRNVQDGRRDAMYLVDNDLPLFDSIQELRSELSQQQIAVYTYYVTADQQSFHQSFLARQQHIGPLLSELESRLPNESSVVDLRASVDEMNRLSGAFDMVMSQQNRDWDAAREVLAEFSPLALRLNSDSAQLTAVLRRHAGDRASLALQRSETAVFLLAFFCGFCVLAAGAMSWLYFRLRGAHAEELRLNSFPQRNPSPVYSLAMTGRVEYANQSAHEMSLRLLGHDDPDRLLPTGLTGLLKRAMDVPPLTEWEYSIGTSTLTARFHWLPDFEEVHLYLSDVTEQKRAQAKLIELAYRDSLTGFPNRGQFAEDCRQMHCQSDNRALAVALLDIDRFQMVISGSGHEVGDSVMRSVAERLQAASGQLSCEANLYRFDGNLFCALLFTPEGDTLVTALTRLSETLRDPVTVSGKEFFLSFSIGVCTTNDEADGADSMLRRADSAMRAVKSHGGNGIQFYDQALDRLLLERIELERNLRYALEREQLQVHYQPQVDMRNGVLLGYEALLRWSSPEIGSISPADFIPIAEQTGLIIPIGAWVMEVACCAIADRNALLNTRQSVAVNISAVQLMHSELVQTVMHSLKRSGLSPDLLELEITEGAALNDIDAAIRVMQELSELGVKLAIDDFGTGYSSLSYLRRLPIQKLKIDQSFIRNMTRDRKDHAVASAVVALGRSMELRVIAEGVETPQQAAGLVAIGCVEAQGFLYGKPMPIRDVEEIPHFPTLVDAIIKSSSA